MTCTLRADMNHGLMMKIGDSTMGKLMEKAGSALKNEGMVEKGRAKREEAGFNERTNY